MQKTKFRTRFIQYGDKIEFLFLVPFDISNGKRRDYLTKRIAPLKYIKKLDIHLRGKLVTSMVLTTNISKNPMFGVFLVDAKKGDKVRITIIDNNDRTRVFKSKVNIYMPKKIHR